MDKSSRETSVHLLGAILEELEYDLHMFVKGIRDEPSRKQAYFCQRQERLINQIADVYDTLSCMTLYDVMIEIQKEYEQSLKDNPDIDGLFIKIPLKENPKKYVMLDFTI